MSSDEQNKPTTNIPVSSWLRAFTLETSRLQWLILLFLLVSIADLVMTYFLLSYSPNFYESNPVANWFFKHWNVAGMTFFKFAVVSFVVVISEFVERRRAGSGKFVLIIGILATTAVVIYSVKLFMGFQGGPGVR
ncbi:MAG: DUF5658 family protein [Gemmatales bacterium]